MPKEDEGSTYVAGVLGKNKFTSFADNMVDSFIRGKERSKMVDPALEFFKGDMSEEDIMKLVEEGRRIEESGQSEAMMQHNQRYAELLEEHNPGVAFFLATIENPTAMMHAQAESTALMLNTAYNNPELVAGGAAGGFLTAKGVNKLLKKIPGSKGRALSVGWTAVGGALGMISATNETALTTVELVQEQYDIAHKNQGKQWSELTNEERKDWYIRVANDEVLYEDLTNRALKRGVAIGMIDAFTGMTVGAVNKSITKKMATSKYSKFTKPAKLGGGAVVETGMGMGSELAGQIAGEQDIDAYEILVEGFADKTFTGLNVAKATFIDKTPKYTINGEVVNGAELDRALRIMDDEAFIKADIKIENSPTVLQLVTDRTNAVLVDQTIDSRISDVNDRAELIKLKTRYEQIKDKSNQIELKQIETKIEEITNKYANAEIDVDVQSRKDAVALALEGKILDRYNSNLQFAKKNASLYGLEVDDTLTQDQIREQYGEEAAESDGFIVGNKMIVNKAVAVQTGAVNVANHELLHGILRKYMVDNPDAFVNIREQLKSQIGEKQWQYVEDRVAANYSKAYMQANPDEWITLTSDAIAAGEITYSESVFRPLADFIIPILRSLGFKKIKFNTGKDVFNFLKEYHRSIEKGKLSKGIIDATADPNVQVTDDIKFSKSPLEAINDLMPDNIQTKEQYEAFLEDQRSMIPIGKALEPGGVISNYVRDRATSMEEGDLMMQTVMDRLMNFNPEAIRKEDMYDKTTKELIGKKGEKVGPKAFGEFLFANTRFAKMVAKEKLAIEGERRKITTSIDQTFDKDGAPIQIADTSQSVSLGEKSTFESVNKGDFVKKIWNLADDQIVQPLKKMVKNINYDINSKYRSVIDSMMAQVNPRESSKNRVEPIGALYPVHKLLSETHWGVNPKAIMADAQTLTNPESINIRNKIIDALDSTRETKEKSKVKRVIGSILPRTNLDPVTLDSIGVSTGLLKAFYTDRNIETGDTTRPKNLKGQALNIDNMEDIDILENLGITIDSFGKFILMPTDKKYNPVLKGIVKNVNGFAFNQEARLVVDRQEALIGIGKPDLMFSKSQKTGFYMGPKDLINHWSTKTGIPVGELEKLVKINTKKHYKSTYDGIYNEKTGETYRQYVDRITGEFLTQYPQFRDFIGRSGFGGRRRSTYGSIQDFNKKYSPTDSEIKLVRHQYLKGKKQQPSKINLNKNQQAIESKKLDNLKDYFVAIQEFIKVNPESAGLFISFYQDGGSAGMGSTVRVSFPYKIYTVDQRTRRPNYTADMREEHNHPANQIHSALLYAAMEGNVNETFSGIRASVMQGSIKIEADNLINDGNKNIYGKKTKLKNAAPDVWFDKILPRIISGDLKIDDGMGAVVRLAIQGVNLNELMIVGENQTVAEHFGVGIDTKKLTDKQIESLIPQQNHLVIQQMTGAVTKRKASNVIKRISKIKYKSSKSQIKKSLSSRKAVLNSIKYSKTGERKGMSTFDFDDTLARTKSGVRYTMPNPEGKPMPGRKVIFLAGSAGSGKSNVINKLGLGKRGYKIVNQDIALEWLVKNSGLPTDMRDFTPEQASKWGSLQWEARDIAQRKQMKFQGRGDGIVVDGTGASEISMGTQVMKFRNAGYDVQMIFVDSSLETALARNRARRERSLKDFIVERNWNAVQKNKKAFQEDFGDNFTEVNTDNLKQGDPMPIDLVTKIDSFTNDYVKGRLTAEEFASRGDQLLEQGANFDFSEFNKVVDGTPGPLLQKARNRAAKYGTEDMFVLTARPQASAFAIQQFLKGQGLDIPIKNITGLANSTGEAKAQWMLERFAEGYNDMYFVDDALQNVEAVKTVLDQLDIKSEVVQAKIKFSKTASQNFNTILEESQGTSRDRMFSQAQARRMGKNKGWWRIFVPPSAEDFKGLLYRFLGTGRQGDLHMKWFKIKLLDPFAKGIRAWNIYKQEMVNEYKHLRKSMPGVVDILNYEVEDTTFTVDDSIRVYLWDKAGFNIPGLDEATKQSLIDYVNGEPDVKAFADTLSDITKTQEGYISPNSNWSLGNISTDLNRVVDKIGRKEFLAEYLANAEAIFTPENMAKIEALYGTNFRSALENIMERMEKGGNRKISSDKNVNRMYNWINGSIGAIMFFNMRSALLQTISSVNFINWSDNNIFKASAAFANQPQFWSDFATLFNSPQLKQRRKGIQIDVSASELSKAFAHGKGTPQGVISWLLEKGFTPTQIADSFAISFGGASFYRNRMNTYLNQGLSEFDANEKAMLDFQEIAEETQQSSREDLISGQQAGPLGRLILAFQNVTMQYTRLTKKAMSDLVNRRGDAKTNISKILYYGMVQNIVFAALQNALMFFIWGGDQEELEDKTQRTLNSALDSFLRGSGIFGAVVSTVKNTMIQHDIQKNKDWGREDGRTLLEIVNISPPIGSKLRKIYNAIKTEQYNKGVSEEIGFRIENPTLYKWASYIEAATNIPTQRLVKKANNLEEAFTGDHEMWQRIHLALGWSTWQIGAKDEELEQAKKDAKSRSSSEKKKDKKKESVERVRCSAMKKSGGRCKNKTKNKSGRCYAHQ